jgi:hypothetical protein
MKTVSRGAMFGVIVEVSDILLANLKAAPDLANKAIQTGTEYWRRKILPDHFKAGVQAKYGYAQRTPGYLKDPRKRGKPLLVLSGSMKTDLRSIAVYKLTKRADVTLSMFARVLNLAPNMPQNSDALYVYQNKQGQQVRYPNTKREVKVITDEELAAISAVIQAEFVYYFSSGTAFTMHSTESGGGLLSEREY